MKVSRTWLKDRGWEKTVDEVTEEREGQYGVIKRHQVTFEYDWSDSKYNRHARMDHIVTSHYKNGKLFTRTSFYMFSGLNHQTGWTVTNRVTKHPFTCDQIKSVMRTLGVAL